MADLRRFDPTLPSHRVAARVLSSLALLTSLGCGADGSPALIGFPYPEWGGRSVETARDEIRELGMSDRVRIVFDSLRTGDPTDLEVSYALSLSEMPGLVAVAGHGGSRGSLAAAPVYNAAGIPQVVPSGTSRLLADAGPWTFTLVPNDSVEGAFIADHLRMNPAVRAVTIFFINDEYGRGVAMGVRAALAASGPDVVDEVPYTVGSDLESLVEVSRARARPDAVVLASRADDAGRIMRAFHQADTSTYFVGGDGIELGPRLATAAGPSLGRLEVATFWHPARGGEVSDAFVTRFTRVVGEDPQATHALRHDALMVLVAAVAAVGPDRDAIRGYLESLGVTRPPYPGVTGPIAFAGDVGTRLVMVRASDGVPSTARRPSDP